MTRPRTKGEMPTRAIAGASWRGKRTTVSRGVGEIKGGVRGEREDSTRVFQELGNVLRFFNGRRQGGARIARVGSVS